MDKEGAKKEGKKLLLVLTVLKIVVVLILAGLVTYWAKGFHHFEHSEGGVEYGIWEGFPLGYYFSGYHINWGDGKTVEIADWQEISRWNYINLGINFGIYVILIGGILYLAEYFLKKIWRKKFKVNW